jgi:ATPase subunit of ABC transporter with duplicated ATPase domains
MIRAILSHATEITGVTRDSRLEKTLFACDELAGFITAASLVRPSKSILDLEAKSVVKRMKDKAFAKGVKREDLHEGAALLGLTLEEHIGNNYRLHARQRRARAERHAVADLLGPRVRISHRMAEADPVVTLEGVTVTYGRTALREDIVVRRRCVRPARPNGAGKSTMIKSLLGFIVPSAAGFTRSG